MSLPVKEIFAQNISDQPQVLRHPLLSQLQVIPVMPGGYVHVQNCRATIPAGAKFRIPVRVWDTNPSAWRCPWTQQITPSEFNDDSNTEEVVEVETKTETETETEADTDPADGFPCPECGKVCKTEAGLGAHIAKAHKVE